MQINQFLILGCLMKYPNGIIGKEFFKRISSLFPNIYPSLTAYYLLVQKLEKRGYINSEFSKVLPRFKKIKITHEGIQQFKSIYQPLSLLHGSVQCSKSEKKDQTFSERNNYRNSGAIVLIDQAEQIDLIEFIEYAILDFTSEEIEKISSKKAEKLKYIADRILKKIAQTLGIYLEN